MKTRRRDSGCAATVPSSGGAFRRSGLSSPVSRLAPTRARLPGNAPAHTTSSARCCASTTRACWPRSPTSATGCCARKPAPFSPPHPPPRPAQRSPNRSCARCSNAPAGNAAWTPKPPASRPCSAATSCASCRRSKTPSVGKPSPCCDCSTPPAPTPTLFWWPKLSPPRVPYSTDQDPVQPNSAFRRAPQAAGL